MGLEHWIFRQNVPKHKALLKDLAYLLTNEIQKRKGKEPYHLDFRYLLPLAQWLCEQGGYTIKPAGNNPGNVMGDGDMGRFHRSDNTEIVDGVPKNVPANFARFSNMEAGTRATFEHLKDRWFNTYIQILEGGSVEAYVSGLYPGPGKNYATQFQSVYTSGVRVRLRHIVEDYLLVFEDDLKDWDNESPVTVPKMDSRGLPVETFGNNFGNNNVNEGFKKKEPGISHSMYERQFPDYAVKVKEVQDQERQKRKTVIEEKINELKAIQTRVKEGKSVQPS